MLSFTLFLKKKEEGLIALICLTKAVTSQGLNVNKIKMYDFHYCLLKEIGRTTRGPELNKLTREVSITYNSSTKCALDPLQNYTSTIVFTCRRGLELVSRAI